MYKTILASIIISACAATTYAGFGDFLSKTAKAVESVSGAVSGTNSAEQEAIAKQLGAACAEFATAKSKAYAAAGKTDDSNKYATLANTLSNEKNLETLAGFIDGEKAVSTNSIVSNLTVVGEDQKALIAQSLQSFAKGVNEEVELGKQLYAAAKQAQDAISNASGAEKVTVIANMKPLLNLSKRFPEDIKNAKETLSQYAQFAKKNGIDISSIAASLLK